MACSNSGCKRGWIYAPSGKRYPCPQCSMPPPPDDEDDD